MADPRAELQKILRDDTLVRALPAGDQQRLLALIEDARRKQREALKEAQAHALRFVPALLRKPLLKLLAE